MMRWGLIALVAFSDERWQIFKFSSSGVEVTRSDLNKAQIDYASQIAKLASEVEGQKHVISTNRTSS